MNTEPTTDPWTHVSSCLPKLDHSKLAFSPQVNPPVQPAYYTGQGWRWANGSTDQADTITHWTDEVEPYPAPPISQIPGDVIPPIVRRWFTQAGALPRAKIWIKSYTGSTGYIYLGPSTKEIQIKLEASKHYQPPFIPLYATHLCYTDGSRDMDFAATEIRTSLATPFPRKPCPNCGESMSASESLCCTCRPPENLAELRDKESD
jgi:hypothetical protein